MVGTFFCKVVYFRIKLLVISEGTKSFFSLLLTITLAMDLKQVLLRYSKFGRYLSIQTLFKNRKYHSHQGVCLISKSY